MKILQDYIVPVVRLSERNRRPYIEAVHGTAFFVNANGAFVTARHVMVGADVEAKERGGRVALVMRRPGHDQYRYVGEIMRVSFAEPPYDLAVGVVSQPSRSAFKLGEKVRTWVWDDVYSAGYPATATKVDVGRFTIDARGYKGYVLRSVLPGHQLMHEHPAVIEVSFAIPKGLSGAPVVLRLGQPHPRGEPPAFILVGVCAGNESSQIVDHAVEELSEGNVTVKETVKRVEEYGVVHDLRPLGNWKPECWDGEPLRDAVRYEG